MGDGLLQTGMELRKLTAVFLLILSSFVAYGVNSSKSELEAMYDKAFTAFDEARYDDAIEGLDAIDVTQPNLAESLNLRGAVYMRQGKFDKAEVTLRKALSLEPKFWNASFNLAEIPFLKKDWSEARNRFTALMAGGEGEKLRTETSQLIEYKIFLTFVMQGKESTADWILNKFEGAKDSPALYYANAAVAFQQGNEKEASDWIAAANKQFSVRLNQLYAESFYEVGWRKKPAGEARAALEITSTNERAARLKTEAQAQFEKAARAFQQRDFEGALRSLDLAEKGVSNDAAMLNLRGEILMKQEKFDDAEAVFRKALAANPKFREAQYNLAQIPFRKGEYAKARDRFEALYAETPGGEKNQAAQLIKSKIFLTLLLEGKEADAQQLMDQFKFTGDTPALYYAQAAWEFKHDRPEQGNAWITSARRIYSPALNMVFADSLYDLSWLQESNGEQPPPTSALAQADLASAVGEPPPPMRFGQAETAPAPGGAETTGATSAAVAPDLSSPAAVAVASAKPVGTPIAAAKSGAKPAATADAQMSPRVKTGAATIVLASDQAGQRSQPNFAEMVDRISNPRSLLILTLLLAGILLLVWLLVQLFRRRLFSDPHYNPSEPLTEPPFTDDEPATGNEGGISPVYFSSSPPEGSLRQVAGEPALRTALLPSNAITARGSSPGVDEPMIVPPNDTGESVSEVTPPRVAPDLPPTPSAAKEVVPAAPEEAAEPVRDREEVSLPAVPITAVPVVEEKAAEQVHATETAAAKSEEPATKVEEVVAKIEEPAAKIEEPIASPEEPAVISGKPSVMSEEPVGQGQPIPHLTTAFSSEPVISEIAQPEPESELVLIESNDSFAASIAGRKTEQSAIETPSFASKIITTEPNRLSPTSSDGVPETTITPAPAIPPSMPATSVQQPVDGMRTAVQLTFSLEIASMQLTPTFEVSGLQLKPTSKVVSMRLARSQDPQPPINLQVAFEVAKIELINGAIATVRLAPSAQQKPAVLTSPSFAVSGLKLVSGQGAAPVQLTPSHQEQASVHLTAEFQIAAIEFTPLFEIETIVLNSTSKKVSMQLPGSGPSSIDTAPVFEVSSVQLGAGNELGLIQVTPGQGA
ncbi:MAG: tetratricopeptide repeat protein [Verrucomicrobiota bacterium]|nr:tetratricopeptide repeat protein [Verrucomicrobiota bacterium]